MTINKAQGQTIPNVGVYLPQSVFSHGQLYVALSRGTSRTATRVLVKPIRDFNQPGSCTTNVVFREVLQDMQGRPANGRVFCPNQTQTIKKIYDPSPDPCHGSQ